MRAEQFYNNKKWHDIRERVLKRDNYVCQESKREQYAPIQATIVHHAWPREAFSSLQYEYWNLISLSQAQHRLMHNDDGSLSEKGLNLAKRVARKHGKDVNKLLEAYYRYYG